MEQFSSMIREERERLLLNTLKLIGIEDQVMFGADRGVQAHIWAHDESFQIIYANRFFRKTYAGAEGKKCHRALNNEKNVCGCCSSRPITGYAETRYCRICRRSDNGLETNVLHTFISQGGERQFHMKASLYIGSLEEISESLCRDKDRRKANEKCIVLCANCHRARTDDNSWLYVDTEILASMGKVFSHGICIDCIKLLYPDLCGAILSGDGPE